MKKKLLALPLIAINTLSLMSMEDGNGLLVGTFDKSSTGDTTLKLRAYYNGEKIKVNNMPSGPIPRFEEVKRYLKETSPQFPISSIWSYIFCKKGYAPHGGVNKSLSGRTLDDFLQPINSDYSDKRYTVCIQANRLKQKATITVITPTEIKEEKRRDAFAIKQSLEKLIKDDNRENTEWTVIVCRIGIKTGIWHLKKAYSAQEAKNEAIKKTDDMLKSTLNEDETEIFEEYLERGERLQELVDKTLSFESQQFFKKHNKKRNTFFVPGTWTRYKKKFFFGTVSLFALYGLHRLGRDYISSYNEWINALKFWRSK